MKFSYKWLKELSGTQKSAQEVADLLIAHAFEVEDVIDQGKGFENIVVGEVLSKEKHPDADRLNVATVNVGTHALAIVCGAPNLAVGQKVVVALVGAKLPSGSAHHDDNNEFFEIKKSKIRGVESNGMICAEDELELGDDHDGIMVLADDAPVGENFAQYKGFDDVIFDIDILPNRAHDALSYRGMAMEICALDSTCHSGLDPCLSGRQAESINGDEILKQILKQVQHKAQDDSKSSDNAIHISIETEKCARYAAVRFDNIIIGQSPVWMQERLIASDITPINNIVDITNYIMLEYGQPTHAFDSAQLKVESGKSTIGVRQAKEGEELTLLNDEEITLCVDDVVITDGAVPTALAGVMGGKGSSISDDTTSIIFEIANFSASAVRMTKSRYGLDTDAAYRFERDLDPNIVADALGRAVELVGDIAGGVVSAIVDNYPEEVPQWDVCIAHQEIERLLGIDITSEMIESILTNLGVVVAQKDDAYICTIPTVRRDLRDAADLIEEIGRVYGYDKITPEPLVEAVLSSAQNDARLFERMSKNFFVEQGFDEVKSYSFYSIEDAHTVGLLDEAHVTLLNPMSSEQALMQHSLVPSGLRAVAKNLSIDENILLFESGRVFETTASGLPIESAVLTVSVTSKQGDGTQFFELKGFIEQYFEGIGVSGVYFDEVFDTDAADCIDLHPSRRALIKTSDGKKLGVMGEVTKKALKHFGVKKARTAICEFDLDALCGIADREHSFVPLSKFPEVARDLSMRVDARTRVADVEGALYGAGGELLQDVNLFDLYSDPETGERSMAFHFRFAHRERTLTAQEVDAQIVTMIDSVEKNLGVEVKREG